MEGMNIGKILAGLTNPELYIKRLKQDGFAQGQQNFNSAFSQARPNLPQNPINQLVLNNMLPMNQIAAMDRSIYIKNLLGLPQTLSAMLMSAQSKTPINAGPSLIMNVNENMLSNQKALAQIFNEAKEVTPDKIQNQILQQTIQQVSAQKEAAALIFTGMIHLPAVSEMILKNSKQAVTALIAAMSTASKNGMTGEQINKTLGVINSCISMAESGNPAQTLKSLMLLYLPWLPLNEEIGFDLEVETNNGENDSNDSKLTVLIQTKNYGNVKGVFTLTTSNSVDIFIVCSEDFPKTLLQKSLKDEGNSHSMTTNIDVEAIEPKKAQKQDKQEAKVNLSATNEMNPYLLLMAHAFIRNTIYLDSNAITEEDGESEENQS